MKATAYYALVGFPYWQPDVLRRLAAHGITITFEKDRHGSFTTEPALVSLVIPGRNEHEIAANVWHATRELWPQWGAVTVGVSCQVTEQLADQLTA